MTLYKFDRISGPAQQILTCRRGERLIGHIVERKGDYHARSWPSDVLIGIYSTCREAAEAIIAASESDISSDHADGGFTVTKSPASADSGEILPQLREIIGHHRSAESYALFRFLRDRGFHLDDAAALASDALLNYEYENLL